MSRFTEISFLVLRNISITYLLLYSTLHSSDSEVVVV